MLACGLLTVGADNDVQRREIDDSLEAFGLCAADGGAPAVAEPEVFHLWPEHLPVLELWFAVQTQWRHGFNGPTGLDYAGVRACMGIRRERHRRRLFRGLQIMERATLDELERARQTR